MGWDEIRQELRWALRSLSRTPGWTAVVVLTLGVAIAANTTVFSLMNPYLFRALPFADPDRLVQIGGIDPVGGWDGGRFSAPQIREFESLPSVETVGGYAYGSANLTGTDRAERLSVSWFEGPLLEVLGRTPRIGRGFAEHDRLPGATAVALIGDGLWERRFGADPGIVGSTIVLDGVTTTVIGVMPADFTFPFGGIEAWLPLNDATVRSDRTDMRFLPIARMAPGAGAEDVRREVGALLAENAEVHPESDGRWTGASAKGLREALNFAWEILPMAFGLLLGAVGLVLLIACVNVASLTLARISGRSQELSVRSALGAGRGRLVRHLLIESLVLALLGGALGVALAALTAGALDGLIPPDLYRVGDIELDPRVLGFSLLVTLTTPLLFGLLPALRLARAPLARSLQSGGTRGGTTDTLRLRRLLVVGEVAVAVVLVYGTGLMLRSLDEVLRVDPGFEVSSLVIVEATLPATGGESRAEVDAWWTRVASELRALPGVSAVGTTTYLPLNHEAVPVHWNAGSAPDRPVEEWPTAWTTRVDAAWFEAAGVRILEGSGMPVGADETGVVISRGMAERLFPGESAVGRSVDWTGGTGDPVRSPIVGVAEEVRFEGLTGTDRPLLYRPVEGSGTRRRFLAVRTAGATAVAVPELRDALDRIDPNVPVIVREMNDVLLESTLLWSVSSSFLTVFGVVALGLAALGVYGLIGWSVQSRRRELGIRMALGADAGELQRSVVRDGLTLAGTGALIGLPILLLGGPALQAALYGVPAADPVTAGAVALIFTLVAVGASAIPARRAARTDPSRTLRES